MINKEHTKEFGAQYASEVSRGRASPPKHPGRPGLIYVQFHIDWAERLREKRDGTNGTRPQDGCNPEVEVSSHISFFAIKTWGHRQLFIRKLKGPRKGNRGPVRGSDGSVRGTEGTVTGTRPFLIVRNSF